MFGFISKKKLKKYMDILKEGNRACYHGQCYEMPLSLAQRDKNLYAQGYEDGTDNFFNALCGKFKIKRKGRERK